MLIAVTGCVAQQEGEKLLKRVPEVDVVMGPQHLNKVADLFSTVVNSGVQIVATDGTLLSEDLAQPIRDSKVRAWVNVIYGKFHSASSQNCYKWLHPQLN